MTKTLTNIGASAKARLLKLSKERREDYQLLLARFANERSCIDSRFRRTPRASF